VTNIPEVGQNALGHLPRRDQFSLDVAVSSANGKFRSDRSRIGWILVHIDHPWHRIAGGVNGLARRKRLAAAVSRLAVSRKSIVCPVGIQRSIQIVVLTFYVDIGLVDGVGSVCSAPVRYACTQRQMQLASTSTPRSATQLGDVLVGEGYGGTNARTGSTKTKASHPRHLRLSTRP